MVKTKIKINTVTLLLKQTGIKQSVFIFLATLLFFILAAFFLPICFAENDDVLMLLFASGTYTGTPEPYLVFINILIGYLLAGLYAMKPGLEWYPVFFSVVHILSLTIIFRRIWTSTDKSKLTRGLFICVFLALEIRFILLFEFTTTAALSALAGIILIVSGSKYQRSLGILLFIISGLIRFEVAMLIGLVISPLFFLSLANKNKWNFKRPVVAISAAILILFFCKVLDAKIYNADPDWAHYKAYNYNRGAINDNPNNGRALNNFPAGITNNDYELLLSFFPDPQHIDLSRMSLIRDTLLSERIEKKMSHFFPFLRPFRYHIILLFIIAAGVLAGSGQRIERWIVATTLFIFFASLFYISLDASIKHRIFFTACLPLLYIFFECAQIKNGHKFSGLLALSLLLFTLLLLKENWTLRKLKQEARVTKFSQQQRLVNQFLSNPANRIIPFGNDLTVQLYPPFSLSSHFGNGKIIFSGWAANIPFDKSRFTSFRDLPGQYGVFLTRENAKKVVPLLQASIFDNYGLRVFPKIEVQSNDYQIIRFFQ